MMDAADWFAAYGVELAKEFKQRYPGQDGVAFAAWCMKRYDKYREDIILSR